MDPLVPNRHRGSHLHAFLAVVRERRFGQRVRCPRCGSLTVQRWGGFSGRQRYRCRGRCGRTFSDLTGTPAAYIKKLTRWPEHARLMTEGACLRVVAEQLGIHITTAFRWRHRVLDGLRACDDEPLTGWIELRSEWFAESRKGDRALDRPARRHGIPRHRLRGEPHRRVIVACDRDSHVVTVLLAGSRVDGRKLADALGSRIRGHPRITSERTPPGACMQFARIQRGEYLDARVQRSRLADPGVHARTAWAYGHRLRRWLARFRGVASRYLPNYLVWHRRIDAGDRQALGVAALRWPLLGVG